MTENLYSCKNCGNNFTDKYCNHCGEKRYVEKDRTVKHLLHEGLHFITHFEGTFFKTFITLFRYPGKFSTDYCNGVRKKYFKPMAFFLMLVILYLLFPIFDGLNVSAYQHVRHSFYGEYALKKAQAVMQEKQMTETAFGDAFAHASQKISKFLLFLIIPVMALVSWIMSFRRRRFYYDNFVFSIEANSFFILWGFLLFPLFFLLLHTLIPGIDQSADKVIIILNLCVFILFLVVATRRFFNFTWWYSITYSILFTLSLAMFIQYIYKFILFYVTVRMV